MRRACAALVVAVALAGAVAGTASSSATRPPCWKRLLNELYSGELTAIYPHACYVQAIKHIPTDLRLSASLIGDIRAAEKAAAHGTAAPPKKPLPQPRPVTPSPDRGAARRLVVRAAAPARPGQMIVVKRGRWGDAAWTLSALETPDGHYCVSFSTHLGDASGCGLIHPPERSFASGLSLTEGGAGGHPSYVLGPIVSTAETVTVTLTNGHVITAKTIPAPRTLGRRIAFYLVQTPCKGLAKSIIGRDGAGREVAHWNRPAFFASSERLHSRLAC